MKFSSSLFLVGSGLFGTAVTAFTTSSPMTPSRSVAQSAETLVPASINAKMTTALNMQTMGVSDTIDFTENAQRDVYSMQQWAQQCGAQTAEGVEVSTQDGEDYFMMTNQNIPAAWGIGGFASLGTASLNIQSEPAINTTPLMSAPSKEKR